MCVFFAVLCVFFAALYVFLLCCVVLCIFFLYLCTDSETGVRDTLRIMVYREKNEKWQLFHVIESEHVKRYDSVKRETE